MLDITYIRANPGLVREKAKSKGYDVDTDKLIDLDNQRKQLIQDAELLRQERNTLSKTTSNPPSQEVVQKGKEIKDKLQEIEHKLNTLEQDIKKLQQKIPNTPLDLVPFGKTEADNTVIKEWGEKPTFNFKFKNHYELAEAKDWIDKERAAKVAGSRFAYIKGDLALMEFALWQFALNTLTDEKILSNIIKRSNLDVPSKPFVFVLPPAVAKQAVYEATGRLNKQEQTYKIEGEDLWLNASAEHTLAPMYMDEILDEKDLPIRLVGYTTAFRREAGTYGKDTEGIFRLHQFNKMEMESFTTKEASLKEHYFMVAIQEYLMQQLKIPYRLVEKCTYEIGFPNAKGVDIEAYIPSQEQYRETHTADYITDFQAESLKTRVKRQGSSELVHTNDATVFSERPLIAILENFQTEAGEVVVPEALSPYMMGKSTI